MMKHVSRKMRRALSIGVSGVLLFTTPAITYAAGGPGGTSPGDSSGTPTPTATTKSAKVTVKSSTSKTLKITWKKLSGVSGYQVCYSTKSSFSGNTKKAVSKSKNTVTIKKLKAGKTYYVKVRAYKTVNGKKSYGTWSKKYKIVVKK